MAVIARVMFVAWWHKKETFVKHDINVPHMYIFYCTSKRKVAFTMNKKKRE